MIFNCESHLMAVYLIIISKIDDNWCAVGHSIYYRDVSKLILRLNFSQVEP